MVRRIMVLIAFIFFVTNLPLTFAAQEEKSQSPQPVQEKSIFQIASDNVESLSMPKELKKESVTGMFQKSHDYIVESAPKAKKSSLRDDTAELKRRRNQ